MGCNDCRRRDYDDFPPRRPYGRYGPRGYRRGPRRDWDDRYCPDCRLFPRFPRIF